MNNHTNKNYHQQNIKKNPYKVKTKSISSLPNTNSNQSKINNKNIKKIPLLNNSPLNSPIKILPNNNKSENDDLYDNLLYIEGKRIINNMNESIKIIDGKIIINRQKLFMNNINLLNHLFKNDNNKKLNEIKPIIKENYNIQTKKRKLRNKLNGSNYLNEISNIKLSSSSNKNNYMKHNKSKSNELYSNQKSKKEAILNQILNTVKINIKERNERSQIKKKSFNSYSNSNSHRTSKTFSPYNTIKN